MKSLREVIAEYKSQGKAIAHFNFSDSNQLKAMALAAKETGLPVVATAAGDNPYFVQEHNGVIAAINDPPALAAALEHGLAAQYWDKSAISQALHAAVGNWGDVAIRVLRFFRERLALGTHGATRPYAATA